jgi:hypothetical protein
LIPTCSAATSRRLQDVCCLEKIAVVADRREYAASLQQPPEIDLVYRTVTKGQAKPVPRERLNVGDGCTR